MGRIDGYILAQLTRSFGFFALVLVGVYWVNRAVILLERYLSEGQGGWLVIKLTLLSIPAILTIVLPVAGFVAALYATNRLHGDSELVVVQATGYSTARLLRPFAVFGFALVVGLSALTHFAVPRAAGALEALEAELAEAISARLLVPGAFQSPTQGVTVYVREISADGTLQGLLVMDRREPGRETTYNAHRALLVRHPEGPRLIMFNGMAQTLNLTSGRLGVTEFAEFTVPIGNLIAQPAERRRNWRELTTAELLSPSADILEATRRSPDYLWREAQLRFSQPLLAGGAVLLGFAALMVGGFSRFGLLTQIVAAVLLVVVAKLLDNAAIDLVKRSPEAWPMLYAAPVFGLFALTGLVMAADGHLPRLRRSRSA